MTSLILTGGAVACFVTAGNLWIDGKIQRLEIKGKEVEAEALRKISKGLTPIVLIGGIVYLILSFPFNLFFVM